MSFKEYLAESVQIQELDESVENLDESLKEPKASDVLILNLDDLDDLEVVGRKIVVTVDGISVDSDSVEAQLCACVGGLHLQDEDGNFLYDENNILHFDYESDLEIVNENDTRDTQGSISWKTSKPKLSNFSREKYDHQYDDTKETQIINEALEKFKADKELHKEVAEKVDAFLEKDGQIERGVDKLID